MSEKEFQIDLPLWRDKELIIRQNKLKGAFWDLFSEIGNTTVANEICQAHSPSKGVKLTKGNDLLGFPYHVLDLIRDFNTETGLNIRLLNWFGHGLFLFVLFGKNHPLAKSDFFSKVGFFYALSPSPWDYPELLLDQKWVANPDSKELESANYHQWFKEINPKDSLDLKEKIEGELKILSDFFSQPMG